MLDDDQSSTHICQMSQSQNTDQHWKWNLVLLQCSSDTLFSNLLIFEWSNWRAVNNSRNNSTYSLWEHNRIHWSTSARGIMYHTSNHPHIPAASKLCNLPNLIAPIKSMAQTILSSYQYQSERTMNHMMIDFTRVQLKLEKMMNNSTLWFAAGICSIILMTMLYIIKCIKYKVRKEIYNLQAIVEGMLNVSFFCNYTNTFCPVYCYAFIQHSHVFLLHYSIEYRTQYCEIKR
jgi:hypothetical protein